MNIKRKKLYIILFICCLLLLCYFSIEIDGYKNVEDFYTYSVTDARKLFFRGKYHDAYECYLGMGESGRDAEMAEVCFFMELNFYSYKKKTRIFFRLPQIPYSGRDGSLPSDDLPDSVKSEIYETVRKHDYFSNVSYAYDIRKALCYKLCKNYKDSNERYQKYIKAFAEDFINKKDYKNAEKIINELTSEEDKKQFKLRIYEVYYNNALSLSQKGLFVPSIELFEHLAKDNYKDSKEQAEKNNDIFMHKLGINIKALDEKKRHDYPKNLFKNIQIADEYLRNKYSASRTEVIKKCKDYLKALGEKSYEQKDYFSTYFYLSSALIADKQDSRILESATNLQKSSIEQGDVIVFGHYEQDGNLENGAEPIEWIVLGVEEQKALLLSKYVLDNKPMHSVSRKTKWKESDLREWLNEDFFNVAFSNSEKQRMIRIELSLKSLDNLTLQVNKNSFSAMFGNPALYKMLGATNYQGPDCISDFVVCPDHDDLTFLISNLDTSAYAVPALNVFISRKEKQILNPGLFENINTQKNESDKVYVPYGYWLRSDSIPYQKRMDSCGFEEGLDAYRKNGVRPEILIKLNE